MLIGLSQLLIDFPQIAELDMNPIMIKDGKPTVVDARLLVSPINVVSPLHLVISPYPGEDISRITIESGLHIIIRPVKPEDAPLFTNLFEVLSPTSIYYRFFGVLRLLQPTMLSRFTQIDYIREITFVAIDEDSEIERMLGVARIIGDPDGKNGEIAVLIGDPWQGIGIGAGLMRQCLLIAKQRGFTHIQGIVMKENLHMLALAKKLGFIINQAKNSSEFAIEINFKSLPLVEGLAAS